jgi:hypothetical protein
MAEETAAIRAVRRTAHVNHRHRLQLKFVQKPMAQQASYFVPRRIPWSATQLCSLCRVISCRASKPHQVNSI